MAGSLLPCTWLNLRSLYASQDVTITASIPGGSALAFKDSQISIDVTAVTSNVARRVVETASVFTQVPNNTSNFALQTESTICKLLQVRDSKGNITSAADSLDEYLLHGYIFVSLIYCYVRAGHVRFLCLHHSLTDQLQTNA